MTNTIRLDYIATWVINPRKHDLPYIKGRIKRYGFVTAVGLRNGTLYAGHGRVAALWELFRAEPDKPPTHIKRDREDGMWLVPYVELDHLSESEAAAYAIEDNVAAQRTKWDKKKLKKIITEGVVAPENTGFTPKQLRTIKAKPKPEITVTYRSVVEVPNAVFPSEPEFGIPLLSLEGQADYIDQPFIKWGTHARQSENNAGTVHFYTDDYKFSAVLKNPSKVVDAGFINAVEPNITILSETPRYEALYAIGQKRWIARYWQQEGLNIAVDMNVATEYAEDNLLGVPEGWLTYCTRALAGQERMLDFEFELASRHAGQTPLFVVYGGNERTKVYCARHDWIWLPEYWRTVNA